MIKALVSETLSFSSSTVWPILEDFGGIASWVPGAENTDIIGNGIGMIRRIHIQGLDEPIDEVLESLDASAMRFSYSIPRGLPFPLKNYRAYAWVRAIDEQHCEVTWQSDCEADGISDEDATKMLEGVYGQLIGWLKTHLEKQ